MNDHQKLLMAGDEVTSIALDIANRVRPHREQLAEQLVRAADLLGPTLVQTRVTIGGRRSRRLDAAMRETYFCTTLLDSAYGLGLADVATYRRGRELLRGIALRLLELANHLTCCIKCGGALRPDPPVAYRRIRVHR